MTDILGRHAPSARLTALGATPDLHHGLLGAQGSVAPWSGPSPSEIDAIYPDIESLYIDLHRNPELAFQETRTAAALASRVTALGFDVTTGVGRTGIVAVMRNGTGPTVMLRTELDALPVEERTGLPFQAVSSARRRAANRRQSCMPADTTCTCPPGPAPRA